MLLLVTACGSNGRNDEVQPDPSQFIRAPNDTEEEREMNAWKAEHERKVQSGALSELYVSGGISGASCEFAFNGQNVTEPELTKSLKKKQGKRLDVSLLGPSYTPRRCFVLAASIVRQSGNARIVE